MKKDGLRVLMLDSVSGFRETIEPLFKKQAVISRLGAVRSLQEATLAIPRERYDMFVLNDSVREVSTELNTKMRSIFPHVKIVLFTKSEDPEMLKRRVHEGYDSILDFKCNEEDIGHMIRMVSAGKKYISPGSQSILTLHERHPVPEDNAGSVRGKARLSRREFEIMQYLVQGLTDQNIAAKLSLSIQTVRQHHKSLKRKLAIAGLLDRLS